MKTTLKLGLSAVSLATLLALAACGGGGGDATPAGTPSTTPPPAPAPTISVQGTASAVNADPLAAIWVPLDASARGLSSHAGTTASAPASLQIATPEGAYKVLAGNQATVTTLTSGKIADVAGDGNYAIGRWTDGSSSLGNISVNQGVHYAVGKPLNIQPVFGQIVTKSCAAMANTLPTAVSGNFTPGKLNSAVATLDMNGPGISSISIDITIGADAHATATTTGAPIKGVALSANGAYQIQPMGTDSASPLISIGYTIPTPSSGDVTGVVVLKCQ